MKTHYNLGEMCHIMGVSDTTFRRWVRELDCPFVQQGDQSTKTEWKFCAKDVVAWFVQREVQDVLDGLGVMAGGDEDNNPLNEAQSKARYALARAIKAEIETDRELGKVVNVEDCLQAVAEQYASVRNALQAVGARVAPRASLLTSAPEVQMLIDDGIREALVELNEHTILD